MDNQKNSEAKPLYQQLDVASFGQQLVSDAKLSWVQAPKCEQLQNELV
jgi:hypothetical protein